MRTIRVLAVLAAVLFGAVVGASAAGASIYGVHALVSDGSVPADLTDASLVNAWGLVAGPTTPWWLSDNGTGLSTLYTGTGTKPALTVTAGSDPTGTVYNGNAADFIVSQGGKSASARFLFATESGTIVGWAPSVVPTSAVPGVDHSAQGAVYKGLATVADRLYATDFHNARVDVFDKAFAQVTLPGGFQDAQIPKGWAPFGIQALNGNLFVTYAQQDKAAHDDVAGGGLGYVDEFSPDGALLARVAKKGTKRAPLNAPWGLAMAPSSFGGFAGDLLVGNFGNGRISAYQALTPTHWVYKGQLRQADGNLISIDGLWGIAFGNGAAAGPASSLYFASGPGDEKHGLFGVITVQ
jgi:uncharacterized protein (TIGR03118 family)